jgi:hypothetical protein
MAKATRENRYPQGYLPKIMYWAEQLYNACEYNDGRDTDRIEKAKAKLDYFYTRQRQATKIDEVINSEQGTISDVPQDYIENEHSKYQKEITPELYNKYFHKETFESVSTEV